MKQREASTSVDNEKHKVGNLRHYQRCRFVLGTLVLHGHLPKMPHSSLRFLPGAEVESRRDCGSSTIPCKSVGVGEAKRLILDEDVLQRRLSAVIKFQV